MPKVDLLHAIVEPRSAFDPPDSEKYVCPWQGHTNGVSIVSKSLGVSFVRRVLHCRKCGKSWPQTEPRRRI